MSKRFYLRGMGIALTLALAVGAGRAMQYAGTNAGRPTADTLPGLGAGHGEDLPDSAREMQAHQLKLLRAAHQKQVVADSARLVQLATALKAETDKGVTDTPGELKDVDEIAKLAKKLSERIKTQ